MCVNYYQNKALVFRPQIVLLNIKGSRSDYMPSDLYDQ